MVTLEVAYGGRIYPAEPVAGGAAYEILAAEPEAGFLPNPHPGARMPYRRFVPAMEVAVVSGTPPEVADAPLVAPLCRALDWPTVHRLSQTPPSGSGGVLAAIRASARIRRGTRMVKVLSGRQLAGHLSGWLPYGFCYREFDIAHLRTPADLAVLRSDGPDEPGGSEDVVFALRWRATDPIDYQVPTLDSFDGLVRMPPRDRIAGPVIGTGFAPSNTHLIPEYVTANLADLPLPAFAELIAYTADGTEVLLYQYLAEQRSWVRLAGTQWRRLFAVVPGVPPEQEYFPLPSTQVKLVGRYRGNEQEALADPPDDFRLLARTRAARYPVEALARRTRYATWRMVCCAVTRQEGEWLRLRLVRPDARALAVTGAACVERGIYEVWAPLSEISDCQDIDTWYSIGEPPGIAATATAMTATPATVAV